MDLLSPLVPIESKWVCLPPSRGWWKRVTTHQPSSHRQSPTTLPTSFILFLLSVDSRSKNISWLKKLCCFFVCVCSKIFSVWPILCGNVFSVQLNFDQSLLLPCQWQLCVDWMESCHHDSSKFPKSFPTIYLNRGRIIVSPSFGRESNMAKTVFWYYIAATGRLVK